VDAPKVTVPGNEGLVQVSWNAPSDSSAIASYELVVTPNAGKQTATGALSVDVSGLACGTKYSFVVESVGKTGLKTKSGTTASYACTAPGAPTGVKVSGTGVNGVKVTWTKPANPGIGELSYDVIVNGQTKNTTGTSATFTGLVVGHPVTASVQAKTAGGESGAVKGSGDAGTPESHNVNLKAVEKYYTVWGPKEGVVKCSWPDCPTWIQRTTTSYDNTKDHGDYVATINNGDSVPGFCWSHGYNTTDDSGVHNDRWIYVNHGGHWGWMSIYWFTSGADADLGLPQCEGGTPTG